MPSHSPMRITAGFTQDLPFQPLGRIGQPNPFWYATFADDFMGYVAGFYTVTNTGNGTVAATPGFGGRLLFTTNSSTPAGTDVSSIQVDTACTVVQTGMQHAFLCRVQLADVLNPAFNLGHIQTTATPFTVTDGIYFSKASGSTTINLIVMSGSVNRGQVAIPAAALTLANATDFDLGYVVTYKGEIEVFAGVGLVGQTMNQDVEPLGPVARLTPSAFPTANLTPTLALQSGTATSKTMNADFVYSACER